jgi:hypothetical protein
MMKKKFFMILAVLVAMALAGPVFAEEWGSWIEDGGTMGGTDTLTVSLSPGVHADYNAITVGGNAGAAYIMCTANENGTRVYGTQFNFEGIIMSDAEYDFTQDTAPTAPTTLGDWASGTWTVMGGSDDDLPTTGGS